MPQALETLCLIHFWGWKNSLFPILALWGNKNWPPSINLKKLKIFRDLTGLKGCKWSSLHAPGTGNPLSPPILSFFLHSLFPSLSLKNTRFRDRHLASFVKVEARKIYFFETKGCGDNIKLFRQCSA